MINVNLRLHLFISDISQEKWTGTHEACLVTLYITAV